MVRTACLLILILGSLPGPGRAAELWTGDDEISSLSLSGYLKSQAMVMEFPASEMYRLMGMERAGQTSNRIRTNLDLLLGDWNARLEYELDYQVQSRILSQGGGFDLIQTAAKPRLWDPDPISKDGVIIDNNLDRLFVKTGFGPVDLTVGRQVISWGSAWFWKPTDRFSSFSPMDVTADVKRGIDAVRAEIYLGEFTSLDLVTVFERHPDTDRELWVSGGARLRTTVARYDLALSAARFQHREDQELMAGLEFSGSLGDVGFRGEAALTWSPEREELDVEGVVGWDYRFPVGLTLAGELFYNGYGTTSPDDYLGYYLDETDPLNTPAKGERLARGEAFNLGRYYVGLTARYEAHPLLNLVLSGIMNVWDPSFLGICGLQWSIYQNVGVTAGVMVPLGQSPGMSTMNSEFGAMPVVGYSTLKLSF